MEEEGQPPHPRAAAPTCPATFATTGCSGGKPWVGSGVLSPHFSAWKSLSGRSGGGQGPTGCAAPARGGRASSGAQDWLKVSVALTLDDGRSKAVARQRVDG